MLGHFQASFQSIQGAPKLSGRFVDHFEAVGSGSLLRGLLAVTTTGLSHCLADDSFAGHTQCDGRLPSQCPNISRHPSCRSSLVTRRTIDTNSHQFDDRETSYSLDSNPSYLGCQLGKTAAWPEVHQESIHNLCKCRHQVKPHLHMQ